MMVVPFVRFPDGTRQELFEYNAELHREFAALVGGLDPDLDVLGAVVPAESTGRLEDERPTLVGTEREQLELQVGGWLRRMLVEGWTYLILEVSHSGRYVQFLTHDGAWLRGEAVGPRYLEGHPPLTDDEHESLCALGWNPPDSHGDDCGNYWVDWGEEVDDVDQGPGWFDAPGRIGGSHPSDDDRRRALDGPAADRSIDRVSSRDIDEAGRFAAAVAVRHLRRHRPDRRRGHHRRRHPVGRLSPRGDVGRELRSVRSSLRSAGMSVGRANVQANRGPGAEQGVIMGTPRRSIGAPLRWSITVLCALALARRSVLR